MEQPPFAVMVNRTHIARAISHLLLSLDQGARPHTTDAYAELLVRFATEPDSVAAALEDAARSLAITQLHEDLRRLPVAEQDGYRLRAGIVVSRFLSNLAGRAISIDPVYPKAQS